MIKKLENYELDKKWGELSVDSIGHLFPNEMKIIKNYITNLEQENEELKIENEKLTQLWLSSQEERRKAINYLKQPYRDNFDYSKSELLEILGGDEE